MFEIDITLSDVLTHFNFSLSVLNIQKTISSRHILVSDKYGKYTTLNTLLFLHRIG